MNQVAERASVDASEDAPTVKGRTAGRAFRQCWAPTPLVVIDLADPEPAIRRIAEAIEALQRKRGCGAYLFVNPQREAFVLSEEKPAALAWVKDRFGWLVGFYRTVRAHDPRIPTLTATVQGLTEDVIDQLSQMGVTE
jgi:hypothetical protein